MYEMKSKPMSDYFRLPTALNKAFKHIMELKYEDCTE